MLRKLLFAIALLAPQLAKGADAVWHRASPGGTFCGVINNATDSAAIDFVFVSGRLYAFTEANLSTPSATNPGGFATGNFSGEVFATTAALVNVATDEPVGTIGVTGWNGTAVLDTADLTWDEPRAGHTTAATFGYYLDAVISLITSGGVSTVEADIISEDRTWVVQQGNKPNNIVSVGAGFIGTFAVKPKLNSATTINTVPTVTITGAATVTATNLKVDRSRTKAHFTVPALTTAGTYTVVVTVTTVDGQTIPTTCTLKVN